MAQLLGPRHRYYDPATGQFLSVDPLVASTHQPYAYTADDPVNLKDPTGLWWCLPEGVSGPCGPGYTDSPPYGMSSPQPPNSVVTSEANGTYQLAMGDGESFTFTANGGIVGNEALSSQKSACPTPLQTEPLSPTTNQEWDEYLNQLFGTSPAEGSGIGDRISNDSENVEEAGDSFDKAAYPLSDDPQAIWEQAQAFAEQIGDGIANAAEWLWSNAGAAG